MKTAFLGGLLAVTLCGAVLPARAASGVVVSNAAVGTNGSVHLEVVGLPGMVYSLQRSRDLEVWRTVDFKRSDFVQAAFDDDSPAGTGSRFYRVRQDAPHSGSTSTNYHGWTNSILLSNGQVEATIVPAVGRVMQFRFLNQATGPFWENAATFGKVPAASSWDTPGSFGGDKVWPSPQSVWNWPPPRGFDSLSYTGAVANGQATLSGPVDPTFGIRVVREILLHPTEPMMRITSRFEKVSGKTNQVGVWVITQVKDAEGVFVPVPNRSIFDQGYTALGTIPKGLVVTNGFVSLVRDARASTKIGNDASAVLWVGTDQGLLIESARAPDATREDYPDSGCSVEVYTNPNPTPYIELELLGPLAKFGSNKTISMTSLYSLFRRTQTNALAEAMQIFAH